MISHYVDSHCHLDRFPPHSRQDIIARALACNVSELVTIATRLSDTTHLRAIAAMAPPGVKIWCTVGTHPDHVQDEPMLSARAIADLAQAPEVVAVGETGLDYVATTSDREQQRVAFRQHIEAARVADIPLIVHARNADDDMALILREEQRAGPFDFVLHCFSSGKELAWTGVELGGFISLSGILTFKKSTALRELVRSLPLDRLLIETDAPYLAPSPKRGQLNEPSFLPFTASVLADEFGYSLERIASLTSANFKRLFVKAI